MSKAIGMVEYKTVSAGVVAADAMVKTSNVKIVEAQTVCPGKYIVIITGDLIELRLARGMCGKSYLFLTGEVAAVEAAIERARGAAAAEGMYLDSSVIPSPDEQIRQAIL